MTREPIQKTPQDKSDPEYMRKAYIYTAILLIVGLIGGLILADRIVKAEAENNAAPVTETQEER